jgi:ParB-like chromosome segregation protein Spo0J|tara:strand:+ start:920 stop:1531 length:612 start_codon:yes stop_codon:yes gene_type:complete
MEWPADKIERKKVDDLIPYARNARTHSDEQVAQLAASIKEWGWTTPVLVDEDGEIIAGHGRVMAARKLNIDEIPTMTATGWSKAQKQAYVLADNQIPLNAGWDDSRLALELNDLGEMNFDLSLLGWGEDLPEFAEMPDYSVLEDKEMSDQLDEMALGVKKAIQIEFEAEHYEDAQELVKFWRSQGAYIGMMLIEKMRSEKQKI